MILPIVAYGDPSLRKESKLVKSGDESIKELISNMFETMYNAKGVGLAAPQIGLLKQIFIIDGTPMEGAVEDDDQPMEGWKRVFINPVIEEDDKEEWAFEEGCLSIPDIRYEIVRPKSLTVSYLDENFKAKKETYTGIKARIIQHEFDHIKGVLFTDYVTGLKKQLFKAKLAKISKGKIEVDYPMRFYSKNKGKS